MRKIYIVLPAYNEENSIANLLVRIKTVFESFSFLKFAVIVVNDGSKDKTLQVVKSFSSKMPITIVNHKVNQGLGPTVRDGLKEAVLQCCEDDIIITMDADDTHTPGLIYRMYNLILEGFDVVIASRYRNGSRIFGLSRFRKMISYFASIMFRVILPIKGVRDFTCGYRAYNANVIKKAFEEYGDKFIDQQGFQVTVDTLIKLRKFNLVFGEVPFVLRYDFKADDSKMNIKKTMINTFKLMLKRKMKKTQ
jgi:dolichol-phosphate mannosyltransferase